MTALPPARPPTVGALPFAAFLAAFAGGCGHRPADGAPDMVVVLVDGLRTGAHPLETAHQALLDAAGLQPTFSYDDAYAQTLSDHAAFGSLVTGRYPSAVPICGTPSLVVADAPTPWCLSIPGDVPTLPQVLGLYGYRTALVTTRAPAETSVQRGFDEVDVVADGWDGVVAKAGTWWAGGAEKQRLLVIDAPLDLSEVVALAGQTAEGAVLATNDPRGAPRFDPDSLRWYKLPFGPPRTMRDAWAEGDAAYQAAARVAGEGIALLLDRLGEPERTRLVALTSLHGVTNLELTGSGPPEQMRPGEARLLLERTIHVPLDIAFSDQEGPAVHVTRTVQLIDLLPTLAAQAGAMAPHGVAGVDLLGDDTDPGLAYAEYGDMLALRSGNRLLRFRVEDHGITSLNPALTEMLLKRDGLGRPGVLELFDVARDPFQHEDLRSSEAQVAWDLYESLVALRTGPARPPEEEMSWEQVQALRTEGALGYW